MRMGDDKSKNCRRAEMRIGNKYQKDEGNKQKNKQIFGRRIILEKGHKTKKDGGEKGYSHEVKEKYKGVDENCKSKDKQKGE